MSYEEKNSTLRKIEKSFPIIYSENQYLIVLNNDLEYRCLI
jgi:hypothetical protein